MPASAARTYSYRHKHASNTHKIFRKFSHRRISANKVYPQRQFTQSYRRITLKPCHAGSNRGVFYRGGNGRAYPAVERGGENFVG